MTVICSGGASEPQPGAADDIILTAAVISSVLAPELAWLDPFISAAVGIVTLHLPTFCAVDPPADPGVNAADLLGLITLGPGPLTAGAVDKVVQLIERNAWYAFCQCSTMTTPARPTQPSAPAGIPAINPAPTGYPATTPCATWNSTPVVLFEGTGHNGGGLSFSGLQVTSVTVEYCNIEDTAPGPRLAIELTEFNSIDASTIITTSPYVDTGECGVASFHLDARTTGLIVSFVTEFTGGGGSATWTDTVKYWCVGQTPYGSQSPCCPPDPTLAQKLDSILQLLTLMQRQAVPFAYITGSVHSGLTGTGSVSVSSILGIRASLTVPASMSLIDGTPEVHLRPGRVNFGTGDGHRDRHELVLGEQLIFPQVAALWTTVGYTLADGVTLEIEELLREP